MLMDSVVGSGTSRRAYDFLAPSFMDATEGASRDRPDDSGSLALAPSSLTPPNSFAQDPSVLGAVGSSESPLQGPLPPRPAQRPPAEWCKEALQYCTSLLSDLKNDPRFLRFLPVVFPPPRLPHHAFQAEDSVIESAFYIWYYISFDVEGILPFVPYIIKDYDPYILGRRLSPDIINADGYTVNSSTDAQPKGVAFHGKTSAVSSDIGSSTEGRDPLLLRTHPPQHDCAEAWDVYSLELRSKEELYKVELILPKIIVQSTCLSFVLGRYLTRVERTRAMSGPNERGIAPSAGMQEGEVPKSLRW
ncbi:hypothetical protein BDM02DRAFT_3133248 [Thelephora ganbajun]|uniref:Uncharacterized protein n=1 Tax=Thelephora ganbajun TaxID=370292 RepID=A0ACB6YXP5_THEGA|nr:hypothetical protein BDM02DRAFT_3133248 [Thelephora ganbajun]